LWLVFPSILIGYLLYKEARRTTPTKSYTTTLVYSLDKNAFVFKGTDIEPPETINLPEGIHFIEKQRGLFAIEGNIIIIRITKERNHAN
jgi:hypothetical protein